MSAPRLRPLEAIAWTLVTAALLVAGWHVAVRTSGTLLFPSPAAVARALGELGRRGVLAGHVAGSLGRVLAGYGLAVLVGVPVGMLMGVSRTVAAALNPLVQLGRPISPLAWTPVVIVLVGIGERAAIVLVFLGALFPLIVAAADGFHGVARVYVRSGHNFGLSTAQLIWRVALPASLPQLIIGLRAAFGVAWLVLVAAEMVALDSGLGYLIIDSRNAGKRYDRVVAGMLLIGVTGLLLDLALQRLERLPSVRWAFRGREPSTIDRSGR